MDYDGVFEYANLATPTLSPILFYNIQLQK